MIFHGLNESTSDKQRLSVLSSEAFSLLPSSDLLSGTATCSATCFWDRNRALKG